MRKKTTFVKSPDSELIEAKLPEPIERVQPVSTNLLSIGVLVLAALAIIGALYVGKEVVLPIVLALVLKLMLQPIMNALCDRLHIPSPISAVLLIILLFGVVAAVALTISVPAST